jgi:hypothetical protein
VVTRSTEHYLVVALDIVSVKNIIIFLFGYFMRYLIKKGLNLEYGYYQKWDIKLSNITNSTYSLYVYKYKNIKNIKEKPWLNDMILEHKTSQPVDFLF